jgi:hypothetical protein
LNVGSPLGSALEMNDGKEAVLICSALNKLPQKWKNLEGNEFLEKSAFELDAIHSTHHLLLDHAGEAIRLKTRAGRGDKSHCGKGGVSGTQQGLEVRDAPVANPWVELIDSANRGLWFSDQFGLSIFRAKPEAGIYVALDDKNNVMLLRNNKTGKIQIYCKGNVEIIAEQDVQVKAENVNISADNKINMRVGAASYNFTSNGLLTNADIRASNVYGKFPQLASGWQDSQGGLVRVTGNGPGAASGAVGPNIIVKEVEEPKKLEPDNRL